MAFDSREKPRCIRIIFTLHYEIHNPQCKVQDYAPCLVGKDIVIEYRHDSFCYCTNRNKLKMGGHKHFIIISCATIMVLGLIVLLAIVVIHSLRMKSNVIHSIFEIKFACQNESRCGCPNWDFSEALTRPKIVGGTEAPFFIYPWLVALSRRHATEPFCAGFIIDKNLIITAAHCLSNVSPDRVEILSRLHDVRKFQGDRHRIDRWSIHNQYLANDSRHLNDIAVIKVKDEFRTDLQHACLPTTRSTVYPTAQRLAVVAGWGRLSSEKDGRFSPILHHVTLPIVEDHNRKCRITIADTERQICAGYDHQPVDTCSGDSGSPLLVAETFGQYGRFIAIGIVSYGNRQCDSSISSGVYTRLSFYKDWLDDTRLILQSP